MINDYLVHWILGIVLTVVWFFGDKLGIPADAITLAKATVPGLLGHALAFTPGAASPNVSAPEPGAQP